MELEKSVDGFNPIAFSKPSLRPLRRPVRTKMRPKTFPDVQTPREEIPVIKKRSVSPTRSMFDKPLYKTVSITLIVWS